MTDSTNTIPPKEKITRWTDNMEKQLIDFVNTSSIEPNWEDIGKQLGKKEEACKTRYREIVPTEERLNSKIKRVKLDEITNFLEQYKNKCEECCKIFYNSPKQWKNTTICKKCHSNHQPEIDQIWTIINNYLLETNNTHCVFCKLENDKTFHFDHINMFEKSDSVSSMIKKGDDISKIKEEINKCQLVCESCHSLITIMEQLYGFTAIKQVFTKELNKNAIDDIKKKEEEFKKKYENIFLQVYEIIKKIVV